MHAQNGVATAEGEVTVDADSEDPAAEIVAEAIATGNFNKLDIVNLARQPVTAADVAGKSEIRLLLNGCFDIMHAGHYNALRQAKGLFAGFRVPVLLVAGIHRTESIIEQKGPPVPAAPSPHAPPPGSLSLNTTPTLESCIYGHSLAGHDHGRADRDGGGVQVGGRGGGDPRGPGVTPSYLALHQAFLVYPSDLGV